MAISEIINYTFKSYFSGIKLILFFSLPLLLAFLIPIFVGTPTFIALGSVYLRTGSIPAITDAEIAVMAFSFLTSLFLISFTIVNINLVIKSQRTGTFVKKDVLDEIGRYTLNVFWIYLTLELVFLIIQLSLSETSYGHILSPLLMLLVSIPVFYAPAALVIDEVRPWRALENSTWMVIRKLPLFILWVALGFIVLSLADVILLAIPGLSEAAPYLAMLANSLLLMPFLLVLQTQIYLTKYTIIN